MHNIHTPTSRRLASLSMIAVSSIVASLFFVLRFAELIGLSALIAGLGGMCLGITGFFTRMPLPIKVFRMLGFLCFIVSFLLLVIYYSISN